MKLHLVEKNFLFLQLQLHKCLIFGRWYWLGTEQITQYGNFENHLISGLRPLYGHCFWTFCV